MKILKSFLGAAFLAAVIVLGTVSVKADSFSINFESYGLGDVNGQDGWTKTGPYDVAVSANTPAYPSFGSQSLRISNAFTSGSFGDWAFAKPLTDAVGEIDSTPAGTFQRRFEVQFDIASANPSVRQEGLQISTAPDRGDGSRMSYLRFVDGSDGLDVFFDDVQGTTSPANFEETQIGTGLDRTIPHTIRLRLDALDGPSNDLVKVWIDGGLVHTGTSWENYYRFDTEASAEQSPRIVRTEIFQARTSGGTAPSTLGKGFLIDNLSLFSGPIPAPIDKDQCKKDGWKTFTDPVFKNQGDCVSFVQAKQHLVDTITVNSNNINGTDSNVTLKSNKRYMFEASGTWTNSLNVSDAEYASKDAWATYMDGYDITPWFLGVSEFDLQVNDNFVDWGAYDSSHTYTDYFMGTGNPVNFRIFDGNSNDGPLAVNPGWYGDNSGSLTVKIYEIK